jgi:NTP pyrophosphatase (non-canonical NTP hydrolase)
VWAAAISEEMSRASLRYGGVASTHEAYGVLCEEVAELFDAIRANSLTDVRREALQVAAVAVRLYLACDEERFGIRSRK